MMTLLAHTAGPSAGPLPGMRNVVTRVDPAIALFDVQTIERFYDAIAVSVARVILTLVTGIGLMGLAITVVGLYGLVSYSVNRRTREIGIRAAVGATYARLMAMLLREGMTPVWIGMAAGLVLSVLIVRALLASAIFSASYDLWVVASLAPALCAVTLAAAFLPARRAATVNPIVALREE
jgi:ABC-type antimicrobial peptide transport system permease subunit